MIEFVMWNLKSTDVPLWKRARGLNAQGSTLLPDWHKWGLLRRVQQPRHCTWSPCPPGKWNGATHTAESHVFVFIYRPLLWVILPIWKMPGMPFWKSCLELLTPWPFSGMFSERRRLKRDRLISLEPQRDPLPFTLKPPKWETSLCGFIVSFVLYCPTKNKYMEGYIQK